MSKPASIVIASYARTAITKFRGSFHSIKATELGSIAIQGALQKLPSDIVIREAYLGNVVAAGLGQAPARQAVVGAGLPHSTICTTVNKVCSAGIKSVSMCEQSLQCDALRSTTNQLGYGMLAGGFENMSQIPHYLMGGDSRNGIHLGDAKLVDGLVYDGLWDAYHEAHMGICGEACAQQFNISREEQDEYARESYRRSQFAIENGLFKDEIVPVTVPSLKPGGNPIVIDTDEEPFAVKWDKISNLPPIFDPGSGKGTVTAANASTINDGAAAFVVMTEEDANVHGIQPLARILGWGDAEQEPIKITSSPTLAKKEALRRAGMVASDIEYDEINEAFSVVPLANAKLQNLDLAKVNVLGGAVSLGHPIGMSGARIIGTLITVLKHKDATVGCASICNGGGGASSIVLERLN